MNLVILFIFLFFKFCIHLTQSIEVINKFHSNKNFNENFNENSTDENRKSFLEIFKTEVDNSKPMRPFFKKSFNSNLLGIKTKQSPYIMNAFKETDIQQVNQYDNEMDNNFSNQPASESVSSSYDSKKFWQYSSNVQNKQNEFIINSNTLNFTNQGLENLQSTNLSAVNHILPPITTYTNVVQNVNYNQQDPLQIIANPIQNLVLRSFENYRLLIKNSESIEYFLIQSLSLPKKTSLKKLDPLNLPKPVYFENKDTKTPFLGKLKFTLENIIIIGLSSFKVENLSNQGRTFYFKHSMPQLDLLANYTIDYFLFDEIPLRISEGKMKSTILNSYIDGSFTVLPDILNVWFKILNLNLIGHIDDVDINIFPNFVISDRFKIEQSIINKMTLAIKNIMPDIIEYLKLTYSKAIEVKLI